MVLEVSAGIAVVVLEDAAVVVGVVGQSYAAAEAWLVQEAPISMAALDVVV